MLQHEELEIDTPASQVRVTPQELARALATIEARKEAESQQRADTISLGEAIRQLDINATPEELLDAIRARTAAKTEIRPSNSRKSAKVLAIVLILCLLIPLAWVLEAYETSVPPPAILSPTPLAAASAATLSEEFPLLSRVPLDEPVGIEYSDLARLTRNPRLDLRVNARAGHSMDTWSSPLWIIRKTSAGLAVECWVNEMDALRIANGQPAGVFSSPTHGDPPGRQMLLPLERLRGAEGIAQVSTHGGLNYVGIRLAPAKPK